MIMSNKVNFIFRGSPTLPAGSFLAKPYYVRYAQVWTIVHFKLLAKMSKSKLGSESFCLKSFIQFKIKTVNMSSSSLSPDGANTATLVVTGQSPSAKPTPDPYPPLQVRVGPRLQGLYVTELGGTPPVLRDRLHYAVVTVLAQVLMLHLHRLSFHYVPDLASPGMVTILLESSSTTWFVCVVCYVWRTADGPARCSSCFAHINIDLYSHGGPSGRCPGQLSDGNGRIPQPSDSSPNSLSRFIFPKWLHDIYVLRSFSTMLCVVCCEVLTRLIDIYSLITFGLCNITSGSRQVKWCLHHKSL